MILNILKVGLRNILRSKVFSALNLISLTLGITFLLLIGLWVHDEWSFNRFHENLDDLYFVRTNANWDGLQTFTTTPGPLRDVIKDQIPEVKASTRVTGAQDGLLSFTEKKLTQSGIYVDPDFLQMFSFGVVNGDIQKALDTPSKIVLTKSVSDKLFGADDPIGKEIILDKDRTYSVSLIVEDVPFNSEIRFDWILPWEVFEKDRNWSKTWGNISFSTYLQCLQGATMQEVEEKIATIGKANENGLTFFLQPMADRYLYGNYEAGVQQGGRIEYIRLFSLIALFLLLIACINFMNMATARSNTRAKEIGVRKSVGASRSALISQFIFESILLTTISTFLALFMTQVFLASINQFFEKNISIDYSNPYLWFGIVVLILITGILAGSYPAFFLSGLSPDSLHKKNTSLGQDRSVLVRRGLVIFQFAISAFLILGTLIIHRQIHFVKNKNLGLDRNHLFAVFIDPAKSDIFRQEVLKSVAVKSTTVTGDNPMNLGSSSGDLEWPGKNPDEMTLVAPLQVGDDFLQTMGMDLVAGRPFSKSFKSDTSNYLLNEAAVKATGIENPIGTEVSFWNGTGKIVGVIKDYHLESLHVPIRPQVLVYEPENWIAWIRPAMGKTEEALAHVEKVVKELNPGYPFEFKFADSEYEKLYHNETLTAKIANIFGILAIIISCLGLLGLAVYSAERKKKEISIRKILGASIGSLMQLLSKEFLALVLLALLLAFPVGWYSMQKWLEKFAYTVDLHWWIFFIAGGVPLVIALFTVCVLGFKAAIANPIEALRSE